KVPEGSVKHSPEQCKAGRRKAAGLSLPNGRHPPALTGAQAQAGDARLKGCYPCAPQTGQAPMPWPASTRCATAICCDREAPAAVEEYWPPPLASQVPWENWSPPE